MNKQSKQKSPTTRRTSKSPLSNISPLNRPPRSYNNPHQDNSSLASLSPLSSLLANLNSNNLNSNLNNNNYSINGNGLSQLTRDNQSTIKLMQNQPLEFSANKKYKYKLPHQYQQICGTNSNSNSHSNSNGKGSSGSNNSNSKNKYDNNNANISNENSSNYNYVSSSVYSFNPQSATTHQNTTTNPKNTKQNTQHNTKPYDLPYSLSNLTLNTNYTTNSTHNKSRNQSPHTPKYIQKDTYEAQMQKLRNNYELEIKSILDGQKCVQNQYEGKIRNMEKQKVYWRESYLSVKEEFQDFVKNCQNKQRERQRERQRQRQRQREKLNQISYLKQQQQQKSQTQTYKKSLKIAQNQLYSLKKQKSSILYDLQIQKQLNRKINEKNCQLMGEIENVKRQNKEILEKVKRLEENCVNVNVNVNSSNNSVSKSLECKKNNGLSFSLDFKQKNCYNQLSQSYDRLTNNSNSLQKLKVSGQSSAYSRHKSSSHSGNRHHRSHSSHSHTHSSTKNRSNITQPPDLAVQINLDQQKQIQRLKHCTRKFDKLVHNQNSQIMCEGLKRLNSKYANLNISQQQAGGLGKNNYYEVLNINKQNSLKTNCNSYYQSGKIGQSSIYRFGIGSTADSSYSGSKLSARPIGVKFL